MIDDPQVNELLARIWDSVARRSLGDAGILAPIFLLSSLVIAFVIWWVRKPGRGFFGWSFPREIWVHASHRTDIKVFLFSGFLGLVAPVLGVTSAAAIGAGLSASVGTSFGPAEPMFSHVAIITLCVFLVLDFCSYWAHRLTHDWALLWPFHATHHSAEVMTPITVYRRHPVDDVILQVVTWIVSGVVLGLILGISVGPVPASMLGGLGTAYFLFNLAGANLRHSHVWLSFGPVLEHIVISPAQHQIHHSSDPRHHNRNYGQCLAIWDWMFGTLYVPKGKEDLVFGLADDRGALVVQPHGGLVRFLIQPFGAAARVVRRWLARRRAVSGRARE